MEQGLEPRQSNSDPRLSELSCYLRGSLIDKYLNLKTGANLLHARVAQVGMEPEEPRWD